MPRVNEKVIFDLPGVCAHLVDPLGVSSNLAGVLAIVQRLDEIRIEWLPFETPSAAPASQPGDWEFMENEKTQQNVSMADKRAEINLELKELRSFVLLDETSETDACIRLLSKDGTNLCPLYFTMGGCSDFIAALHKYCSLKRSAKDNTLIMVCDEKTEKLQQSVNMLFKENSQDFLSKIWSNPYAAAISGLGKVSNYLQENVLPTLLLDEFDKCDSEEQQYAVKSFLEITKADQDCDNLRTHDVNDYVHVQFALPERPPVRRDSPVNKEMWDSHVDKSNGSVFNISDLKARIFHGGLEPELRQVAWKFLLGVYDWNSTTAEREEQNNEKKDYYYRMKLQWKTISTDQQSRFSEFRERSALIDKDVARTDRNHDFFEGDCNSNLTVLKDVLNTYMMYNFDLGYVQGMSDLLSPIMVVMQNEVDSFWAFVGFMQKVHRNFEMTQQAIKQQLMQLRELLLAVVPELANYLESNESDNMYFCFRWLLVVFKREFSFRDIMRLWEVLWTELPCKNFHLLICLAILDQQKDIIIENKFGFTGVLKHVNDLSMRMDLDRILRHAEGIFYQLAASQNNLPPNVCEHLGFDTPQYSQSDLEKLTKIDDWTESAKAVGVAKNLGGAKRVDLERK